MNYRVTKRNCSKIRRRTRPMRRSPDDHRRSKIRFIKNLFSRSPAFQIFQKENIHHFHISCTISKQIMSEMAMQGTPFQSNIFQIPDTTIFIASAHKNAKAEFPSRSCPQVPNPQSNQAPPSVSHRKDI